MLKVTLAIVLTEDNLPGPIRLSSPESTHSPSSFLMSSSSLSKHTPLTTFGGFFSNMAEVTTSAVFGCPVPNDEPGGEPTATTFATAVLFFRNRFPFWPSSLLDSAETGLSSTFGGDGMVTISDVACFWVCWRLWMRLSIWASLLITAVWELWRDEGTLLWRWDHRFLFVGILNKFSRYYCCAIPWIFWMCLAFTKGGPTAVAWRWWNLFQKPAPSS